MGRKRFYTNFPVPKVLFLEVNWATRKIQVCQSKITTLPQLPASITHQARRTGGQSYDSVHAA